MYLSISWVVLLVSLRGSSTVPIRWRAVVLLVAALMAAGQAVDRPKLTYPFVSWKMYARDMVRPTFQRYLSTDDRGVIHEYPFVAGAFSEPRALIERVFRAVEDCACSAHDPTVDSIIIGLGAIYLKATGRAMIAFHMYDVSLVGPTGAPGAQVLRYSWSAI
jgi:hypothetical protein